MNIVTIGAAGFIGHNLSRRAAARGHRVLALARSALDLPECKVRRHDVLQAAAAFPAGTDAVFYLPQSAGYRDFPEQADDLFGVGVLGAVRSAMQAREAGAKFFCHASTGSVYAPSFLPRREDAPVAGKDPYALSKLMGEEALDCFRPWLRVLHARIFGAYGPGQKKMLPMLLYERVRKGLPIFLAPSPDGDREGLRVSFMYIDDLSDCLLGLAEQAVGGADLPSRLNVAGPEGVSLRRFAGTLAGQLGREALFTEVATPRASDLLADISLLRALVKPSFTGLDEGLRRLCEYERGRRLDE